MIRHDTPPPEVDRADHQLASDLAEGAAELLVRLRDKLESDGEPPYRIKALGDAVANRWILDRLAEVRPDDPVLSEEQYEHPEGVRARLNAAKTWIIDPLDGTREFSEIPRVDWAVHIAIAVDHVAAAGAVSLPALGETYTTLHPAVIPPHDGPPRLVVSRTRPAYEAMAIREALDGVLVPMGSAGAKTMAILRGEADIYAHSGGQYEWDSCAPVAVAAAAGLWVSRLDGSPLRYNQPDPYLPDLLICRPEMADVALKAANSPYGF